MYEEMKLLDKNHSCLKTVCEPFDFLDLHFDPVEFAKDLVKFMYDNGGISISANQVGFPYRIIALRGHPENFVCFNPKIVNASEKKSYIIEPCLTYKGVGVKIKRSDEIRVRFNMPNGDTVTETFRGLTAHLFQHELEHLDGKKFYNKATKYHIDQAFKNR